MTTPVFEDFKLFSRSLGEDTDVVSKEMFLLQSKHDSTLALRPENTAGIVRAALENGMNMTPIEPLHIFYAGPMFRYERPQKGRFRQFHQIGVEIIGDSSPVSDITVIELASHLLEEWGIKPHTMVNGLFLGI